jgi:DNA-binding transcriptional MerR regulator
VAAVARRLGVAPATLRTWDRRYGLGPSEHRAGAHRRYSSGDVTRLLVMRRLTLEGVAPSEAARAALAAPEGLAPEHVPSASEVMDAYARAEPMAADPAGLAAAAWSFDNAAMRWMLTRVHPRDALAWWADFVQPALALIAGRAAVLRPGEGAGAALTAGAFAELRSRAVAATAQREPTADGPPATVVLVPTGSPDGLHLHVLATALQSGGVRVRLLAWSEPVELSVAVGRLAPAAVVIDLAASDARPVALGPLVAAVRGVAGDVPVFVHKEGSAALDLSVSVDVHRVRTMTGALHEVLAVV